MVEMKTRFILSRILLLVLTLLLCGCQDVAQGTNGPSQQASETAEHQTEEPRSQKLKYEEEKAQILAFWEAHEDELESIAQDFIEFQKGNTDAARPYADYRPENGLMVGDGLGNAKKAEAPLLEQQLEQIFSLADCPFDSASADVQHGWVQADYCDFSAPSTVTDIFSISLIYFPDAEFEFPEGFPQERVAEHWVFFINWRI